MTVLLLALLFAPPVLAGSDGDGDGVLDGADACPTQPEDLDGFEDGDGCPDPDNDADGVPDTADQCPTDAEDLDGHADFDGCPDPDNDGDGIADVEDPCPAQAGPGGCPADSDAIAVPFAKLTRAVAEAQVEAAEHAFTAEGWDDNIVGPSGLRGRRIFAQGKASGWSLVPVDAPLMLSPELAVVPCEVRLIETSRPLEQVIAIVVRTSTGWRILGVGEREDQVKASAVAWMSAQPQSEPEPDAQPDEL